MDEKDIKTFKEGDIIFNEGTKESVMYDIHFGLVQIYKNYGKRDQVKLGELRGGFFGEYALVHDSERSATAVAGEDTELAIITPDTLERYFSDNPLKIDLFLQTLCDRIRDLDQRYVDALTCINEYNDADKKGEKPSADLIKRMKNFKYI